MSSAARCPAQPSRRRSKETPVSDQTGNNSSRNDSSTDARTVLLTGATGYIGGRLVPRLLDAGHRVKVLVRAPEKIAGVPWFDDVEVVKSSLDDPAALENALQGVDVLYYLVHSMAAGSGFEAKEKAM